MFFFFSFTKTLVVVVDDVNFSKLLLHVVFKLKINVLDKTELPVSFYNVLLLDLPTINAKHTLNGVSMNAGLFRIKPTHVQTFIVCERWQSFTYTQGILHIRNASGTYIN